MSFLGGEGDTVPKSRGTRKLLDHTEESWGRQDRAGLEVKAFPSCSLPEPRVLALAPAASTSASSRSSSHPQINEGAVGGASGWEQAEWRGRCPSPVPSAHPEAPTQRPFLTSGAWGGAWTCGSGWAGLALVSTRSRAGRLLSPPPPSWPWCSHRTPRTPGTSSSSPPHPSRRPSCS